MAQTAEKVIEFPAGGIADFYMEDDEIETLEREEAVQEFGSAGIATFEPIALRMASYGRHGDDTVAHVETGELVIPKALIEDNPRLRASIFSHLEELGVEDPERYVVGSGANSINPNTGLPEFFFNKIKKAFSKIGRGVKKAFKSVAKVIKKAAPVIIPFALNAMFPGLGAIYSGALGSGIGTLVQGGSIKDAFKNALIGGAIGGATAAIGGGLKAANAGGSFGKGAMSGIQDAAKLSNLSTAGKQLVSGQFGQAGLDAVNVSSDAFAATYPDYGTAPDPVSDIKAQATDFGAGQGPYDPNLAATPMDAPTRNELYGVNTRFASTVTPDAANISTDFVQSPDAGQLYTAESLATTPQGSMNPVDTSAVGGGNFMDTAKSYYDTATDYLFQGGKSDAAVNLAKEKAGQDYLKDMAAAGIPPSEAGLAAAKAAAGPGMLATYGPSLALAAGATAALGGFTPDELDEMTEAERLAALGPSGYDVYMANIDRYKVKGSTPMLSQGQYVVPTNYPRKPSIQPLAVAEGGEIFPRRVGGIMPNEGTPGKDSVRAMLMPGEFVMTTDAVRGLGNGNNDQGIKNMYQMMRGLEAKGRATA